MNISFSKERVEYLQRAWSISSKSMQTHSCLGPKRVLILRTWGVPKMALLIWANQVPFSVPPFRGSGTVGVGNTASLKKMNILLNEHFGF